ncbi:MAG: peptide chain release factor N(5)-glutamine methyltransferase [Bacteroidetes bacterium]|nr:peptide chain release factor N(5)-glutamine methyltransferase [Bacteroidota bacterium]
METLAQSKQLLIKKLEEIYTSDEATVLATRVFEDVLNIPFNQFVIDPNRPISAEENELLSHASERLLKHEPLQYVSNKAYFLDHIFYVDSSVLIPRPETEELVLHASKYIQTVGINSPTIIDLCTGSGCITISLKHLLPNAKLYALDVSEQALNIAKRNAEQILAPHEITILQADLLSENPLKDLPEFDMIVSNPPYVLESEKGLMHHNVLDFEPHLALFVEDDDALIFYRKIAELGLTKLKENGVLFLEINEQKGQLLQELYESKGYKEVTIIKDINGRDRMLFAKK